MKSTTGREIFSKFIRLAEGLLVMVGLANVIAGTVFAWRGELYIAATCIGSGILVFLIGTIDKYELVKGLGLEAKTRELTRKLDDADHMLDRLRSISKLTAAANLDLLCGMGRWDSAPTKAELLRYAAAYRALLEEQSVPPQEVREVMRTWAKVTAFDMSQHVVGNLRDAVHRVQVDLDCQFKAIPQPRNASDPNVLQLQERHKKVTDFQTRLIGPLLWSSEDKAAILQDLLASAPELSEHERSMLRSSAAPWLDEISHLQRTGELKNSFAWLALDRGS